MKYQLIILSFLFFGCTSSITVVSDNSLKRKNAITYHQVQERIANEEVEIITNDRLSYFASDVLFYSDSIYFVNVSDKRRITLPLSFVHTIVRTLNTNGAILGLAYGSFLGAITGGLIGALVRDHGSEMSGLVVIGYGAVGALTGAAIGTAYGSTHGSVIEYKISQDSLYAP